MSNRETNLKVRDPERERERRGGDPRTCESFGFKSDLDLRETSTRCTVCEIQMVGRSSCVNLILFLLFV